MAEVEDARVEILRFGLGEAEDLQVASAARCSIWASCEDFAVRRSVQMTQVDDASTARTAVVAVRMLAASMRGVFQGGDAG
jgi:hypothetical protein